MVNKEKEIKVKSEKRIRVLLILPIKAETLIIFQDLITELYTYYRGLTHSNYLEPSPFTGYFAYIDEINGRLNLKKLDVDDVIILFIDIEPLKYNNYKKYFIDLKKRLIKETDEKDIWITFQPIQVLVRE